MPLRIQNCFTPETNLEKANEKLREITRIIFPRVALTSTVKIRRILGLPDDPEMSIETRMDLIDEQNKNSTIPDIERNIPSLV